MNKGGTYQVFDRCIYLMNVESVSLKDFLKRFETTRSSFFRDKEHLKDFYDIDFKYDRFTKRYIREGAK